jgi:PPK2 family polyphosphate:nucleotide phosphotransferase
MRQSVKHWEKYVVESGAKVRLKDFPSDSTEFCDDKQAARAELKRLRKEIDALAATMAAEQKQSLLVILQGVDASGKDGTVKHVFTGVNPQFCKVTAFKEPDREERDHDYLWRIYRALPAAGELGVFNRSQYEDVLVPQARGEITHKQAHVRLRQIADVERAWSENGLVLRKFFLHISRGEQKKRFEARLESPDKRWKVEPSDFADRKRWPKFQSVYEELLRRTSTKHAPWYVIPADHKWYRDVAVAGVVLSALRAMHPHVPRPKLDRMEVALKSS